MPDPPSPDLPTPDLPTPDVPTPDVPTPDVPTPDVRRERVVVVGAGLAGARAVQELRAQGHLGAVVLVGAEPHLPYDRPPLSKGLLSGAVQDTTLEVDWAALGVELRLGTRATGLVRTGAGDGVLETDRGDLDHDGLVIVAGARALPPPWPVRAGGPWSGVLRTVDDARELRARLTPGARVVVVGAGWIGAEVATAAAAAGCRVTVVEAGSAPLAGALGEQVGALTLPWYAAAGIEVRLGTVVTGTGPDGVLFDDGTALPADVVLVGIGARPDTGWLQGGPLEVDRGVCVDAHLQAAPGVVAAGDCAAWESRLFEARLRVEHWDDALHAPAVAVATLLGADAVHDPVPYFWSEQLGHRVQHCGHAAGAQQVVHRGKPGAADGWTTCWLRDGRLVAVLAVDRPRDLLQGRRAVAARRAPDPDRLADPAVPLREA